MPLVLIVATALLASLLAGVRAQAAFYEEIKWCKGNWKTELTCLVVEKVGSKLIEKQVSKKVDEWFGDWLERKGFKIKPPPLTDHAYDILYKKVSPLAVPTDFDKAMRTWSAALGEVYTRTDLTLDVRALEKLKADCLFKPDDALCSVLKGTRRDFK